MTELTPPPAAAAAVPAPLTPPSGLVGRMRTNGNERYCDGDESYQRVSNMLKNLKTSADSYHLDMWKQRQVAIGMSKRPDLVLGVAAATVLDPATGKLTDEAKSTINSLCKQAGDVAGNKAGSNAGTAVHTATERLDLGETVEQVGLPYPYSADLQAYATLCKAMRLRFRAEHIERSVRNRKVGTVGSYDRLGESELLVELGMLAPGELLVVDVKTEGDPLLNMIHIAPQLATYANSEDQFVPEPTAEQPYAGRYEPMPNVSKTIGLVIHVRDGRATPYLIDLVSGWEAAQGAAAQRERVKASKIKIGEPGAWVMPLDVPLPPATALVQDAAAPRLAADRAAAEAAAAAPAGPVEGAYVQEAVRGADGLVTWQLVPEAPAVPVTEIAGIPDGPAPLEAMLWEAISTAPDLATLADLYEQAGAQGIAWAGPIEQAGTARARVVSCVQREMHDPATTAKCACGWARGMAP